MFSDDVGFLIDVCGHRVPSPIYFSMSRFGWRSSNIAYQYSCQPPTWSPGVHAEMFRCVSRYGTTETMTATQTDFAVNTIAVQQRNVKSNLHLFALAIMYA
ncbi:hypothetical protein F4809DRAFT_598218 [Biscogniauxia mediterranea]|nr:hypothetical protein F4809DRAFT_598218 [Biscogniauxia mediterranea]